MRNAQNLLIHPKNYIECRKLHINSKTLTTVNNWAYRSLNKIFNKIT
jgi:hypothetical protein